MDTLISRAHLTSNVRVVVGKIDGDGNLHIRTQQRFKNTATRNMTESICNYLAGAENTYKRGKGRPNFMGIGTMGIVRQNDLEPAEVAINFEDKIYEPGETTRPWFESTSLGLTTVCGPVNVDESGNNTHFWDPQYGWGKDGFTGEPSDEPIFQGELCTAIPRVEGIPDYDDITRLSILRADVLSDCPADWDYGSEGYGSEAIFYSYGSVEWVRRLLHPQRILRDPDTGEPVVDPDTGELTYIPVGPQLNRMAISEFGLYEKNNTDPHGLETMLAGFRVPTADDLVYVSDGEVILIEWRVIVRALMPAEGVRIIDPTIISPTGIKVLAAVVDEKNVNFTSIVRGPSGVSQNVTWEMDDDHEGTTLTPTGSSTAALHIADDDNADVIYITAASVVDQWILAKTAVITGLIKNLITGITITTESVSNFEVQLSATVLGKGTFIQDVTWSMTGQDPDHNSHIDPDTGLITIDFEETSTAFRVVATSVGDSNIFSVAAVVRIDKTSGAYTISDFTLLTEGDEPDASNL